jgi:hypothetical protein
MITRNFPSSSGIVKPLADFVGIIHIINPGDFSSQSVPAGEYGSTFGISVKQKIHLSSITEWWTTAKKCDIF